MNWFFSPELSHCHLWLVAPLVNSSGFGRTFWFEYTFWYFDFFKELEDTTNEKSKGKKKLSAHPHGLPTLVLPGEYTSQDGKDYARWVKLLWDTNLDKRFYLYQPFRTINFLNEDWELQDKVTCGAGHQGMVLNADGDVISCHQLAKYSSYDLKKRQVPIIQAHSTLTGESVNKVEYVANLLHIYDKNLFSYFEIITK